MSVNCLLYGRTTALVTPFCQPLLDAFHELKLSVLVDDPGTQIPLLGQYRRGLERHSAQYANSIGLYAKGAVVKHIKFSVLVAVLGDTKQGLAELDFAELMDSHAQNLLNDQARIIVVGSTTLSLNSLGYHGALVGEWFPNTVFVRYRALDGISRQTALEVVAKVIGP